MWGKKKWDDSLFANRQSRKQKINYSLVGPDKLLLLIANYEDPWQGNCRGDYKMVYHSLQGNIYANVAELDMNKEHGRLSFYY